MSLAQDKDEIIQQRVEFISEQLEDENIDLTNIVEQLNFYYEHPLNLNSATSDQLRDLWILSDIQINDLQLHIKLFGKLISQYELQSLEYWDMSTIKMVLPFIRVDDKLDQLHVGLKEAFKNGKFEVYLRYQDILENKSGYDDVVDSILENSNSYYHGNSARYYTRLRFSYRTNLSVGITAEKDPGEQFFKGKQKYGFDFYSAHAFYKGGKYVKSVALGDYQVQIGQGLNFWSGYAFGKSADVTNVKKSANPLRAYTSVDETRFLRGAAVVLGVGDFSLTAFGSRKAVDASVVVDSLLEDQEFVSSINLTGFHRTNSEIERKNALIENIYGANFQYAKRNFQVGVAAVSQGYNSEFIKDIQPYNQFDFRGKNSVALSADYSFVVKNFNFFGEISRTGYSGKTAVLSGILFSLDKRVSMAIVARDYDRAYQTFYNAGFAEGSRTQNERGLYAGLKLNLSREFSINSYLDVFKFPWMKFQVDGPSDGYEIMIQPSYKPSRSLEIYTRFRQQMRQKNSRDSDGTITGLEDVLQRNYRINFNYKISEAFRLKSRVEYVTINRASNAAENGIIITQDLLYRPKSSPIDIALRYALFDTDSYDTRIYTFESNALYVFSVPAYYYKGSRAYALIRYTFLRKFDLWVRYGVSIFANRTSLGSGAEEITGNTKTDVTIQLRMKL
ncbi:hypothetical protein N9P79_01210 [Crocinitomicaceae bacterium]|nr:hypothetical protein [Crocinitomicaceae bacterium]|tara:strand:+ start:8019 stop:10043 length:2025 start_codon:yes stop_codon:yes gene_type:complete